MSLRNILFHVGFSVMVAGAAVSQQASSAPATAAATPTAPELSQTWSDVLEHASTPEKADSVLTVPQVTRETGGAVDFLNHLFFEIRTEYWRTQTDFTGQPTVTGVINVPPGNTFNPAGIPDPSVFQSSTNESYSFLNFGTRGWGSDRINTNFSMRYRADLTHVTTGSPGLDILNTFPGNRKFEFQTGYIEINGKPGDGFFAGSSVRLGRQYVYGAELAALDGVSFTRNRPKYSLTVFGGRRFTFFSDPDQRALGGVDFVYRLRNASLEYSGLFYVRGSHIFSYRQRLPKDWLFNTYVKMIGGSAVDFSANAMWAPANGKTNIMLGFFQKLSDKDYFYDYTYIARDTDPYNRLLRLYLGPLSPYSQFTIDVHRSIVPRLRLGGTLWIRRLNDSSDQGPFDTSFQDYRISAQVFPVRRIETFLEFHQRDLDRKNPVPAAAFDDVSAAGETRVQDFSLQVGKSFGEGRLTVRGGGFLRRLKFQDRFFFIDNVQDRGWLGNASVRLDQHTRVYFDYSLDTDFFVWRPSIKNGQVFRLGLDWKY